jgi:hypothetical protein
VIPSPGPEGTSVKPESNRNEIPRRDAETAEISAEKTKNTVTGRRWIRAPARTEREGAEKKSPSFARMHKAEPYATAHDADPDMVGCWWRFMADWRRNARRD